MNNHQTINKAAITTGTVAAGNGLLNEEQSKQFLVQTFEKTALNGFVRHEMRRAQKGKINKVGVKSRLLRPKVEDQDDGYRAAPTHGSIDYSVTPVRLPWELTEETLRQNIEGQGYEATVTNLMTTQMALDQEDLCLNGDVDTPNSDPDHEFLSTNDGWVKQIVGGGHLVDANARYSGLITLDLFYDALQSMPNKYNNGNLRWLMSPLARQEWERYILNKAVNSGGIISDKRVENPAAIPALAVPGMPNDKILLTGRNNLMVVNTYTVVIRKTTEGKDAIYQDKRFYVIHFDFDPVVEELDAAVAVTGLQLRQLGAVSGRIATMYIVELTRARSYLGKVRATPEQPQVTVSSRQEAEELVSTGYFRIVGTTEDEQDPPDGDSGADSAEGNQGIGAEPQGDAFALDMPGANLTDEEIQRMQKDDLLSLAADLVVDVSGCRNNDERAAAIIAFLRSEEE